jgi:hypothetical protein
MPLPFQTCWDRLDRAEFHRKASIDIWNSRDGQDTYTSFAKIDDDGTGRFFIRTIDKDWLLPLSFEIGEMLYHLRAALDSCVYDAAIIKFSQDPPPDEQKWQFPICSGKKEFDDSINRMKKLPPDLRTLLEGFQPYARPTGTVDGKQWDLGGTLEVLNNWARIDRHRKLHFVGSAISTGNLEIGVPRNTGMSVEFCHFASGARLVEHDVEIARFKINNYVPGSKIRLHPKFAFEVVVDEAPRLVKLQDVALAMCLSIVAVREAFEKHFGITR